MERDAFITDKDVVGRKDGVFYTELQVGPRFNWHYVYYVQNGTEWYRFEPGGWHHWYTTKAVEKLATLPDQEQQLVDWSLVARLAGTIRQRYQRSGNVYQNSPIGGGKTIKGIEKWILDTNKRYMD